MNFTETPVAGPTKAGAKMLPKSPLVMSYVMLLSTAALAGRFALVRPIAAATAQLVNTLCLTSRAQRIHDLPSGKTARLIALASAE